MSSPTPRPLAERPGYSITDDPAQIDLNAVHGYLTRCYWSLGIPRETVEKAIKNSHCFSLYKGGDQIGFIRVITDCATFGYLCDVFILEEHQKQGLGTWFLETVLNYPKFQGFRRWMLATRDAHGLYRKFGFTELKIPERYMEMLRPDVYKKP